MPERMNTPPMIVASVGVSFKIKKANVAEPIGSPSVVTATKAAGRYFSAQLNVECPINWGSAASRNIQPYVFGAYPSGELPEANMMTVNTIAPMPYTIKMYGMRDMPERSFLPMMR